VITVRPVRYERCGKVAVGVIDHSTTPVTLRTAAMVLSKAWYRKEATAGGETMRSETLSASSLTPRQQFAGHFLFWLAVYAIPCSIWWTLIILFILADAAPCWQLGVVGFLIGGPYAGLMLWQHQAINRKYEELQRVVEKKAVARAVETALPMPGEADPSALPASRSVLLITPPPVRDMTQPLENRMPALEETLGQPEA
jgi:hypothetical protein